ncbi:MAG TPA: alkaline phosphatase family protein [Gemmatimonadaceae bacterium]
MEARHRVSSSRTRVACTGLVALAVACASAKGSTAPPAGASTVASTDAAARPRLAVMIVVDQFREPYLERYGDLFTGGFRRLLDQGRLYARATHDHAITETAVGHATLATGVYPMRHGIVANEWQERTPRGLVDVSNVGDSTAKIVGYPTLPGVSPHYLMRPGLADWIVAADPRSQVASVSAKDRGAVLPAAHAKGQVYWFEPRAGRFVTSTYYRDRYPAWADQFTARVLPRLARDSVWASTIPAAALGRASADEVPWEGDGVHTAFPHRFADEARPGQYWSWFAATPMLDAATLEYARTMVTSLGLGRDDAPDFLNVSLSQTDRIGHAYGPLSREQLDNLLRLDRELGEFFTFLDRTVGAGRWVVGLSADHGSLVAPETPWQGERAGRRGTPEEKTQLRTIHDAAAQSEDDPATPERTAAALRRLPFVADAYTHVQLERPSSGTPADSFAVLERRALFPGRYAADFSAYGVEYRLVEGWLGAVRGTGHGTPYWYDRHVPLLFMGPGFVAGRDTTRAATVDFAPTLARVIGVPAPAKLDGHALVNGSSSP